jgi:predicted anti-sigma-YlaC factor YlaD
MIDLFYQMMQTPDAQNDPYVWAAALMGHFAIGVILTAIFCLIYGAWLGCFSVCVGYFSFWEGAQLMFFGSQPLDSVVDASAVACGSVLAAGAWRHKGYAIAGAVSILGAMGIIGVNRRSKE